MNKKIPLLLFILFFTSNLFNLKNTEAKNIALDPANFQFDDGGDTVNLPRSDYNFDDPTPTNNSSKDPDIILGPSILNQNPSTLNNGYVEFFPFRFEEDNTGSLSDTSNYLLNFFIILLNIAFNLGNFSLPIAMLSALAFLLSKGQPEKVKFAKDIIKYAIIGYVFIILAQAIVTGIFNAFTEGGII